MFYADWYNFWRGDFAKLNLEFGAEEIWQEFYGGSDKTALMARFREDLQRAQSFSVRYVVFHVSNVSLEETFTYQWRHSDEDVIDTAAEMINALMAEQDCDFEILLENQWWPGFTLTSPETSRPNS